MNENKNGSENKTNKPSELRIIRRTVVIFAVCVGIFALLFSIDTVKNALLWFFGILSPVFIGVIIAIIVNPLNVAVENLTLKICAKRGKPKKESSRKRLAHGLGVTVSIIVVIAVIALLLVLIIPEFLENLVKLIDKAPGLLKSAADWLEEQRHTDSVFFRNFDKYIDELVNTVTNWLSGELSTVVTGLIDGMYSVVVFVIDFLISLVVCVYALLEKKKFIAHGKKLVLAYFSPEKANDIFDTARYGNEVFGKFLSGKIITSSIVGILTFIFMTIMGMPYPIIASVFVGVTNVIPYFGPFIGAIPTAFIILITDVRQGIIYIIFTIILQQVEGNIIEPKIMEDQTGVSAFWVTFALLLCGGIFGIMGLIFAVPVFAVLFYVIRKRVARRLTAKEYPLSSDEYLDVDRVDTETGELLKLAPKQDDKEKKKGKAFFKKLFKKRENKPEETPEEKNGDK